MDPKADAVVVSNHGGRQIKGEMGLLDALPAVVAAVEKDFPVLFDSGIRRGQNVFKAIALGARAVLVGRPWVYGLGLAGLENLIADLYFTLTLSGHNEPSTVKPDCLQRVIP